MYVILVVYSSAAPTTNNYCSVVLFLIVFHAKRADPSGCDLLLEYLQQTKAKDFLDTTNVLCTLYHSDARLKIFVRTQRHLFAI